MFRFVYIIKNTDSGKKQNANGYINTGIIFYLPFINFFKVKEYDRNTLIKV